MKYGSILYTLLENVLAAKRIGPYLHNFFQNINSFLGTRFREIFSFLVYSL